MLLQPRNRPIVFGGASLRLVDEKYRDFMEFRPPIKRGDLPALLETYEERPRCVLITDGVFGEHMAVTATECMDLIKRGWLLFGASSMGALRAADCANIGMQGVGNIFLGYKLGYFHSDSDVAVLYEASSNAELSISYVQADFMLQELKKTRAIASIKARKLLKDIRAISWFERNPTVISRLFLDYFGKDLIEDDLLPMFADPHLSAKAVDGLYACEIIATYYLKRSR